ncbi:MAG: DUF1214 domain-containing protein [Lachnospiraceae bacterium]|nr:DUF1214 domain-containing protein [Lachnospiraceae bacterium]MEE3460686.1 DUF1214 domain-containing protein [Lachnospiraceae bacterium]
MSNILSEISEESSEKLFIYSYAYVTSGVLSRGNVKNKYVLHHGRKFVNAKEKFTIVRPNNDTLYSTSWTQLKNSPYILELPEIKDRYVLADILDTKTDIPFAVGSKNGKTEGKYIFVYRNDPVPEEYKDYKVVRLQDSRNFFILRLESFNSEDYKKANAIQDNVIFKAIYPDRLKDRGKDIDRLFTFYIDDLSLEDYYKEFVAAFDDAFVEEDYKNLTASFGINIENGRFDNVSENNRRLLEEGRKNAERKIKGNWSNDIKNGSWTYGIDYGWYRNDFLLRARIAYGGYGANLAEDSIYPSYDSDVPLKSDKAYRIHFYKDKIPYAKFFWSLTLYGEPSQFLADNEIDRYLVNSHMIDDFFRNADGSIDIFVQQNHPADEKYLSNWLPAPKDEDEFSLTMRIYGPSNEQLKGIFEGPEVIESIAV